MQGYRNQRAERCSQRRADDGYAKAEKCCFQKLRVIQKACIPAQREAAPQRHQPGGIERVDHDRHDRQIQQREAEDRDAREQERFALHRPASCARLCTFWNHTIGAMRSSNITTDTADATGQSRLMKNSSHSTRPIISVSAPPRSAGIVNSPTAGMKTSRQPPTMPGTDSGKVMSTKASHRRAPRSEAASSRSVFRRSRLA